MQTNKVYHIAVVGLGYVGLPLAQLFLHKGHTVYGIDTDDRKIQKLTISESYLSDITNDDIVAMVATGRFFFGNKYDAIERADVVIFCVPTPLDDQLQPDLTFVRGAICSAVHYMKKGQLFVLESTTYPGTTEDVLLPLLESGGMRVGKDVALAYSPERIDPGQNEFALEHIPKVVSGVTSNCMQYVRNVYETAFQHVVVVSSPKIAEMTKLLENSQRYVNISFMNEMAVLCDKMGIDLWEAIAAASTKPYGFASYYPGPGVGGHCIPVDPLFLLWKAKQCRLDLQFVRLAHDVNEHMPAFVLQKVIRCLQSAGKSLKESRILLIGMTYKKDVNDMRESPAPKIMTRLIDAGAEVNYYDPYVAEVVVNGVPRKSIELTAENIKRYDCTLILTDHTSIAYDVIANHASLVIDTRNATSHLRKNGNIVLL